MPKLAKPQSHDVRGPGGRFLPIQTPHNTSGSPDPCSDSDATGPIAEFAVRKYRSHRGVQAKDLEVTRAEWDKRNESDNDETYEQGGGEEAEGDQGEDDGQEDEEDELEDDADLDPEIRTQAQNARAPAWQPWQDRLLIVQVNADRPFLAPRRSRTAAW
ncbi:hypothetical protein B0H14DRAFT_3494099 [Mycena olivaceomarginata]|nr:hypothetical protein B0H14DRAFT_3494099 [Mycena olivaceomarginata]